MYSFLIFSPHIKDIKVPMERKGPKGIGSFPLLQRVINNIAPVRPAVRQARKTARRESGQPRIMPIKAPYFTSPMPIPPLLTMFRRRRNPAVKIMPESALIRVCSRVRGRKIAPAIRPARTRLLGII